MWLLENVKLHMWLALYSDWTALIQRNIFNTNKCIYIPDYIVLAYIICLPTLMTKSWLNQISRILDLINSDDSEDDVPREYYNAFHLTL